MRKCLLLFLLLIIAIFSFKYSEPDKEHTAEESAVQDFADETKDQRIVKN